ncbi:uncharacterized protein LOC123252844, partial [Gracilinanus agilis]|uniref:uncharacterized protein LOC123252844 n=1 Tax=Gracilinanus agilis TaxID=191870 RepID=UPI001CFF18AA
GAARLPLSPFSAPSDPLSFLPSRLTAQWSLEDEEEAARERRRRERDRQLRAQSEDGLGGTSPRPEMGPEPEQEKLLTLRPPELEEDEGFSDWSQKLEQRKQRWGPEGTLDGGETPQEESPDCEDRTEGSSHRSEEEEEEEEEDPALSQTAGSLSQLCVGAAPGPEEEEDDGASLRTTDVEHVEKRPEASGPPARDEEDQPPLSPTPKLVDRTESLNRSIKKSNSVKKSQPALPVAKIDDRLEQYTQAIGVTAGSGPRGAPGGFWGSPQPARQGSDPASFSYYWEPLSCWELEHWHPLGGPKRHPQSLTLLLECYMLSRHCGDLPAFAQGPAAAPGGIGEARADWPSAASSGLLSGLRAGQDANRVPALGCPARLPSLQSWHESALGIRPGIISPSSPLPGATLGSPLERESSPVPSGACALWSLCPLEPVPSGACARQA